MSTDPDTTPTPGHAAPAHTSQGQTPQAESAEDQTTLDWLRANPYVTVLLIAFTIGGMVAGPLLFPAVPLFPAVVGGALFGVFCTICVTLPRLLG